ncbi:MAG: amidase [Acidobacteria bacterium]|jgi:amidase|nr:amidase [Acidobacteriota bacterium]MDP7691494.1 amidase [Vicinamibacterales bacterium]HJN43363.1 amidase [Vicinamibacterales bacterium]|tara:strand:- start:5218 stop:6669 length:1452 start_codon:yes stop_codon:yes gene_type:complete
MSELCDLTARELARLIHGKEVSAREVMTAHLARIDRVNPAVNAIVTLLPEAALEAADTADVALARGDDLGPLHGLPIAHKDLFVTAGIRTTFGSLAFRDHVPDETALIVERERQAGAITIGKTNTPELGAGSQTFNEVFGATRNPYDLTKTCGGSSGGAAVALATGMLPIADGSDLGGSLRNPASFCNVVGLRASPGRVPRWPSPAPWFPFNIHGPMARTVGDAALLLDAVAGPDPVAPLSLGIPATRFASALDRDFDRTRVAWSPDLGGLPVETAVTSVLDRQRTTFESLGCFTEDAHPDLSDSDDIFTTWRAWYYDLAFAPLLVHHRHLLKDTVIWNIEAGQALTGSQVADAERKRAALYHRVRRFMERYEFLLLPVTQVVPFDVEQPYVTRINDEELPTYLDWMKSCYQVSVTGLPAVSVPCGFTDSGLPVGLQIVGRPYDELGVLQLANAFEQATGFWKRRPNVIHRSQETGDGRREEV